jgi:hypothetical protein
MKRSAPTALLTLDEAATVGSQLREVNDALLRQPAAGRARWWVSPERYVEVSVVEDAEGIAYIEVGLRERLARFVRGRGTTTSLTEELTLSQPAPASRLERAQASVDQGVLEVAVVLLTSSNDQTLAAAADLLRSD